MSRNSSRQTRALPTARHGGASYFQTCVVFVNQCFRLANPVSPPLINLVILLTPSWQIYEEGRRPEQGLEGSSAIGKGKSCLTRARFALGEGGLGVGEAGGAEAGVDVHREPGVGQGLGGTALAHES